nr:protein kinase domain-containing protein [Aspergillus niger CBS 513.88]|eukprot:XP_001400375.2 protein kinase domain-containing protein [Aspergillus niger CBS 513.88]
MTPTHMPFPLSVRTQHDTDTRAPPLLVVPGLTPPVTPTVDDESLSGSVATLHSGASSPFLSPIEGKLKDVDAEDRTVSTSDSFTDELEYHTDPRGQPVEFGRGLWSVVYKATPCESSKPYLLTPPSSPAVKARTVAVKSPARRDAHSILDAESARLDPGGYIADSHSIVMSAVPLALSTYIEEQAAVALQNKTTRTMFEPIQGMTQWHDLAKKLITGLCWLHDGPQMVHGDVKPHNILLRARSSGDDLESDHFPYEPLFADFSSAHPISNPSSPESSLGTALTALTPPFTAPELLRVSSLKSPDVAPTPESDVFSLAVTLLAAATGDLLLYPGANHFQRLAMAREGHRVIEFARSGPNGSRIPRNGIVEQIIKPAIVKEPSQRIKPADWVNLIESISI